MVLPALAAGVEIVRDGNLGEQVGVQLPSQEPRRILLQVDAHDQRAVAAFHHFMHQLDRRLAPQWFNVVEPGGAHPLLVPGAHVGQVDVAEDDPGTATVLDGAEQVEEHRFEGLGRGVRGQELKAQG